MSTSGLLQHVQMRSRPRYMNGSLPPAWFLSATCLFGLLTGCGGEGKGATALSSPEPSTAIGEAVKSPGAALASVPWSDRDDFEPWQPPMPPGQDGWPTEPLSRWPDVRARLVLPDTVQPGETVDYAVLIRNQSKEVIDLRPCGGYRQEVQAVGSGMAAERVEGGESQFRLNCDELPRLRPGEQRTYAMRLVVPEGIPGNEVLFTWGFIDNMPDYQAQEWVGLSG